MKIQDKNQNNKALYPSKLLISLKKAYNRFLKIRGNPREIALGFALGLFIGMTPYMGLQMAISVFFAALLKWNKFAAATGVWISNPFTAPVLYGFTYYTGSKFLAVEKEYSLPEELNLDLLINIIKNAPEIFWTLTVGGIILGIPLAIAGYYLSFSAILKYRERIKLTLAKEKKIIAETTKNIKNKIRKKKRKKKKSKKKKNSRLRT